MNVNGFGSEPESVQRLSVLQIVKKYSGVRRRLVQSQIRSFYFGISAELK